MRVRGRVAKLIENDGNHGGTPRAFRNRVQLLCLRAPPVACSDVEEKKAASWHFKTVRPDDRPRPRVFEVHQVIWPTVRSLSGRSSGGGTETSQRLGQ